MQQYREDKKEDTDSMNESKEHVEEEEKSNLEKTVEIESNVKLEEEEKD